MAGNPDTMAAVGDVADGLGGETVGVGRAQAVITGAPTSAPTSALPSNLSELGLFIGPERFFMHSKLTGSWTGVQPHERHLPVTFSSGPGRDASDKGPTELVCPNDLTAS